MSDLIDRRATYDVLTDYYHQRTEIQHKALKEALSRVPSAEPQIIMCQHCKEFDENHYYCTLHDIEMSLIDFCSYAERREDG